MLASPSRSQLIFLILQLFPLFATTYAFLRHRTVTVTTPRSRKEMLLIPAGPTCLLGMVSPCFSRFGLHRCLVTNQCTFGSSWINPCRRPASVIQGLIPTWHLWNAKKVVAAFEHFRRHASHRLYTKRRKDQGQNRLLGVILTLHRMISDALLCMWKLFGWLTK